MTRRQMGYIYPARNFCSVHSFFLPTTTTTTIHPPSTTIHYLQLSTSSHAFLPPTPVVSLLKSTLFWIKANYISEGITPNKPSEIPTITIVDLTDPINLDTDESLAIHPTLHEPETETVPELEDIPMDDEPDLFEFQSEAFDTALRIDESREDKTYIAVYGTGSSFIRDFCKFPFLPCFLLLLICNAN